MLNVSDDNRVRTLTLNRPEALNAFNEALYDATAQALLTAADDPDVAVVVITGAGRAFSAGADLVEMQANITNPRENAGQHGFFTMLDVLSAFPKPLICAVNGVGVGIGATILGYADLAFMSSDARLKCPFTSLGVAPEAASSFLLPRQVGRQNAAWILMSSEWITAAEALEMGLVWKVCEPTEAARRDQTARECARVETDFESDGGQDHDDGSAAAADRCGHRARDRVLRRAHWCCGERRGAVGVHVTR